MSIYHEKQHLQFCAVHAINNLFQNGSFCSKQGLDEVCVELNSKTVFNPHRSWLHIGNYDVNVISVYLEKFNYRITWFDKRKPASIINTQNIKGFLINSSTPLNLFRYQLNINYFKHWYAITQVDNSFYNLDSKLNSPSMIGDSANVIEWIQNILNNGKSEVLIVSSNDINNELLFNE